MVDTAIRARQQQNVVPPHLARFAGLPSHVIPQFIGGNPTFANPTHQANRAVTNTVNATPSPTTAPVPQARPAATPASLLSPGGALLQQSMYPGSQPGGIVNPFHRFMPEQSPIRQNADLAQNILRSFF